MKRLWGAGCLYGLSLSLMASPLSGERLQPHQVVAGETWASLAQEKHLSVLRLQQHYNAELGSRALRAGDLVWLPVRARGPVDSVVLKAPRPAPRQDASRTTMKEAGRYAHKRGFVLDPDQQKAKNASVKLMDGYMSELLQFWVPQEEPSVSYVQTDYQLPLFGALPHFSLDGVDPSIRWRSWWPEYGVHYERERLSSNLGVTWQPWQQASSVWRLNGSLDYQPASAHRRLSLGSAWQLAGLDLVVNRYAPLGPGRWVKQTQRWERPASGQEWRLSGRLPFYPQLSLVARYYSWQGQRLSLFGSGDGHNAAAATQYGFTYTPIDSLTLSWQQERNSKGWFHQQWQLGVSLPLDGRWQALFEFSQPHIEQELCRPFWRQSIIAVQR